MSSPQYNLAISSIGWEPSQSAAVAGLIASQSVSFVELAPTNLWPDTIEQSPNSVSDNEIRKALKIWEDHNIKPVAMQSMLFLRPDLTIFDSPELRKLTLKYLSDFIILAGRMGIKKMVFGSPKNRRVPDELGIAQAEAIAVDFFQEIGRRARRSGVVFCIEPNPTTYNCNFVVNAAEGSSLVRKVNEKGFRLHLDAAGMTLAGDNVNDAITENIDILTHFHISAPYLEVIASDVEVDHHAIKQALNTSGYRGIVSIEMKPGENKAQNIKNIKTSLKKVKIIYDL